MSEELAQISRYVQEIISFNFFFKPLATLLPDLPLLASFRRFRQNRHFPIQLEYLPNAWQKFHFCQIRHFVTFAIYVNKATLQGAPLEISFKIFASPLAIFARIAFRVFLGIYKWSPEYCQKQD